jgi:hypothetical protein
MRSERGIFFLKNRAGHGPAWKFVLAGNGMWHRIRTRCPPHPRGAYKQADFINIF